MLVQYEREKGMSEEEVLGSRVKGSSSVALSRSTSSTTSCRCDAGSSASSPLSAVVSFIEFMPLIGAGARAKKHPRCLPKLRPIFGN